MKTENNNINSDEFDYKNFKIDEKDFRMWVFDRHNSVDSAIFEPVKIPDKNKLLEQIPPEYTIIRNFIASSPDDELALELTKERNQHRKELEQEYIKEKLKNTQTKEQDDTDFDMKSENLRKALMQAYENTDAKISFSSLDYSQIKKATTNRQKKTLNNTVETTDKTTDEPSDEETINSQLKKYKTANICLITLIFALLIFFVGQRYVERNLKDELSLFYSLTESSTSIQENTENATETEISSDCEEITSETEFSAVLEEDTAKTEVGTVLEETAIKTETSSQAKEVTTLKENISLININTASAKELQSLEGIGEVKAARIIEYRETYGNFSSIRDILKVSGIGEKTYEKIKDKITVD